MDTLRIVWPLLALVGVAGVLAVVALVWGERLFGAFERWLCDRVQRLERRTLGLVEEGDRVADEEGEDLPNHDDTTGTTDRTPMENPGFYVDDEGKFYPGFYVDDEGKFYLGFALSEVYRCATCRMDYGKGVCGWHVYDGDPAPSGFTGDDWPNITPRTLCDEWEDGINLDNPRPSPLALLRQWIKSAQQGGAAITATEPHHDATELRADSRELTANTEDTTVSKDDCRIRCLACGSTNVSLSTDGNHARCRRCGACQHRTFAPRLTDDPFERPVPIGWAPCTHHD